MGCAASAPAEREPTEMELEAEEHEQAIMEAMQRYETQLEVLRVEVTKAKEAYHSELARETNQRLGNLSTRSRKAVDAKQQAVKDAEERVADLRHDMQDEITRLRKQQRGAALDVAFGGSRTTQTRL